MAVIDGVFCLVARVQTLYKSETLSIFTLRPN